MSCVYPWELGWSPLSPFIDGRRKWFGLLGEAYSCLYPTCLGHRALRDQAKRIRHRNPARIPYVEQHHTSQDRHTVKYLRGPLMPNQIPVRPRRKPNHPQHRAQHDQRTHGEQHMRGVLPGQVGCEAAGPEVGARRTRL